MDLVGLTLDVFVSNSTKSFEFWRRIMGRQPDLVQGPDLHEWQLWSTPEVNIRIVVDSLRAGHGRVALGVADLGRAIVTLREDFPDIQEPYVKPNVIATVSIEDPDGNIVTVWQDLLQVTGAPQHDK